MATSVIMPALEMAQESGILVHWLKHEGETVSKGEPIMEIETDKVTLEIEAAATGLLGGIIAKEGDVIPVGRTIAWILAPGERLPTATPESSIPTARGVSTPVSALPFDVSPVARKIAEEHGIDLHQVRPEGARIEKADILAYMQEQMPAKDLAEKSVKPRLSPASPKARRLAAEKGPEIGSIPGSGPEGAVLAADVLVAAIHTQAGMKKETLVEESDMNDGKAPPESIGSVWRIMAEHMAASWTSVPHFYLVREVDASSLVKWREQIGPEVENQTGFKLTFTDLLVRLLGGVLPNYPRLNASWEQNAIRWHKEINISLAVAVEDGLVAPVIPAANQTGLAGIVSRRHDLVERAQSRKLRPADVSGGTFTLSNLGMYHVDAFNAIVNTPQAAILAVGQIADRVVPVNGEPGIRPTLIMTLSCDHRVVDGARAAQFLDSLSNFIENPWRLLI